MNLCKGISALRFAARAAVLSFVPAALVVFGPMPALALDTVSLGVPEFPERLNLLDASSPLGAYVKAATTTPLIKGGAPLRLEIADNVSVSADSKEWSFHISSLARFSDGRAPTPQDVEYSIRRCVEAGALVGVKDVRLEVGTDRRRSKEQWVRVALTSDSQAGSFPQRLAQCPVLDRSSSVLFGSQLGYGSNFIAVGDYQLADFKLGREYTLQRSPLEFSSQSRRLRNAPQSIVFRSFKEDESALTALRVGTIDAFLAKDENVIRKAVLDETLSTFRCSQYTQVVRKGLRISCPEAFVAAEIQYAG